jgi:hypothetical protein
MISNKLKNELDTLPPGVDTLRRAIYMRRKELNVSRRLLGDACGVDQYTIWRMENYQYTIWRMENSQMHFGPEHFNALEMGLRIPKGYLLQLAGYI